MNIEAIVSQAKREINEAFDEAIEDIHSRLLEICAGDHTILSNATVMVKNELEILRKIIV